MKKLLLLILLVSLFSCSKKTPETVVDPPVVDPPVIESPVSAQLAFPEQNQVCNQGEVLSEVLSSVTFKWNKAAHAESYKLVIKNLESGLESVSASTTNEQVVTLNRKTPYSWNVISLSSKTSATAQSATWKFYNAGPGVTNYAPFPAELISPVLGTTLEALNGKVILKWSGNDIDEDIVSYEIYLQPRYSQGKLAASVTTTVLDDVAVMSGTTYSWKVITIDSQGNRSDSGESWFKVK